MLSLQNYPSVSISSVSNLNGHAFPSDQDPQRRNSAHSTAETSASPGCPAIEHNPHPISCATADRSNNSSEIWDGEGWPGGSQAEWGVKIYENPFADTSHLLSSSLPAAEYDTITHSHVDSSVGDISPKIEELDDVEDLQRIKPSEVENNGTNATDAPANVPRKRGRPRKHPLLVPAKVTKGRSKTGCKTCRRRKKKCDETKPAYVPPPLLGRIVTDDVLGA